MAKDHSGLSNDSRFLHFVPEVVSFPGPFTHAGKDGIAPVFIGNIADQFHNKDGLANTRSAEETNLAAPGIGEKQVDNLDACFQHFGGWALLFKTGSFAVNGPIFFSLDLLALVNGLAQHIDHAAKGGGAYGNGDWTAGIPNFRPTDQAVS